MRNPLPECTGGALSSGDDAAALKPAAAAGAADQPSVAVADAATGGGVREVQGAEIQVATVDNFQVGTCCGHISGCPRLTLNPYPQNSLGWLLIAVSLYPSL